MNTNTNKKTKIVIIGLTLIITLLLRVNTSSAMTASSVTRHGITWTFDRPYEVGQFVNGDPWVVGPVTITSITPDYDSTVGAEENGWEINPAYGSAQGFSGRLSSFDTSLVPSLPYTSTATVESIVKTISALNDSIRSSVETSAVLTVVGSTPAADSFRPPYIGTTKPFYTQRDIQTSLLPSLGDPGVGTPTLQAVKDRFEQLRLEHLSVYFRWLRAKNSFLSITDDGYKPDYTVLEMTSILRLMLDDSYETKKEALSYVLQTGIDKVHHFIEGYNLPNGGGHEPNHWVMGAFAAVMLDITAGKTAILAATNLHEYYYNTEGLSSSGLWGGPATETGYWDYIRGLGGNRSQKDPYSLIDGGKCGAEYQLLTAQGWKNTVLIATLIPEMQALMVTTDWNLLNEYASRWVNVGIWSQSDPCAPYTVGGTYGVDYGPDPDDTPFDCILDTDVATFNSISDWTCTAGQECGRYPEKHGTLTDEGIFRSIFTAAMWDAYLTITVPIIQKISIN